MKYIDCRTIEVERGLKKYEILCPLGKGSAGIVDLVRNKVDGL